jgi:aryl-alcohol dehydrogenase
VPARARAAVLFRAEGPFEISDVEIESPRADEVQVRIEACGVCHTDAECAELVPHPSVLGHEGCGVIESVGEGVHTLRVGQRVALSYPSCGHCTGCAEGRPYHCEHGLDLSLAGSRLDGSRPVRHHGSPISSAFFQQSSFATRAVVPARSAVPLPDDLPPWIGAALPCGVQTGAGAIINSLKTRNGERVAVFGVGAVGMSAVMAAVLAGAEKIVAVDVNPARLALALELGATHAIDAREAQVAEQVVHATGGGADVILDTSGRDVALRQAIGALAMGGRLGLVTVPDWGQDYRLGIQPLFERCGALVSIIQGSSVPGSFLPFLIDQYARGRFPVDRLIRRYDFANINQAFADSKNGTAIKPILMMPEP